MLEFQEKRRIKKILYSPYVVILLAVILIFLLRGVWGVYQKSSYSRENLERAQTNYNELQARERKLSEEIEYLKTTGGKEEEIREKYGLIKPNEEVIMVVDPENKRAEPEYLPDNKSWWQKIFDMIQ